MKKFMKKYGFITLMLLGIVAGCIVGAAWPGATALEPFGTLFINMMFCVVVPMVFCSIASAIANMSSAKRAGRIMGITVGTFLSTAAIAAILMYVIVRFIPVFTAAPSYEESGVGTVDIGTLIINFFTKPDFTELWSRRAILPLIVAAIIFGFGIQMCGGRESRVALLLNDLTDILLKVIKLISYYAPVGFFGFFASLVATHGSDFVSNYARAIGIYYVVSVIYLLISSPLYARFGGGKGAAKVMFRHLFRPAATAFGTCSSVATIPVNMEVSEDTGISKEVSDIVMPLGATMHMDGSAMGAIIKVAFLFGMFGKDKSGSTWKLESHTKKLNENNEHIAKLTADYETFTSRAQTDEDGYYRNPVKLDGLAATDAKSVGTRLQEIAKNATTGGEYLPIGELYGFPILVKTESSVREGVEVKQNRFFIEGAYKYTYNNGQLAMSDHKAAATNFLNALDRIPKLMEQYRTENEKLEKDLPTLREVAGGTWKKEDELKQLKSEMAVLERKIQLELVPPTPEVIERGNDEQQIKLMANASNTNPLRTEDVPQVRNPVNERSVADNFIADHITIGRPGFHVKDKNELKGIKL